MSAMSSEWRYWAFISYSHQDNLEARLDGTRGHVRWAEWLHGAMENWRVPEEFLKRTTRSGQPMPERFFPVFQDEKELPINADLGASICKALEQSRYLIVICSPRSARSIYVNEEVRYFRALGRNDRIMTLIIDGEPNATDGNKAGFAVDSECFCPALRYSLDSSGAIDFTCRGAQEPIAGDVRLKGDGPPREARVSDLRTHRETLDFIKLKLLAGLMGVGFDELAQRDKARALGEARARARRARLLAMGFAVLGVLAVCAAAFAWWQRDLADASRREAIAKGKEAVDNYEAATRNAAEAQRQSRIAFDNAADAKEAMLASEKNAAEAERQSRLAKENAADAQRNASRAQAALSRSHFFRADELVNSGKTPEALAFLARAIRVDPSNHAAARRALMLLQEQPWFVPERWPVPESFEVKDACFLDAFRVRFLVTTETGIGVCDEAGKLLHPLSVRGESSSGDEDKYFFVDGGRVYCIEKSGRARQYWDAVSGKAIATPNSERQVTAVRSRLARSLGLDDEAAREIVINAVGTYAAVPSGENILLLSTTDPSVRESIASEDATEQLVFEPLTSNVVAVGGSTLEGSRFGFVRFPQSNQRFDLPSECNIACFFPLGRRFVTWGVGDVLRLWDVEGRSYGELGRSDEEGFSNQGAVHVSPDGRGIVSLQHRLRAIGRGPVGMWPGEDAADAQINEQLRIGLRHIELNIQVPDSGEGNRTFDTIRVERQGSPVFLVGSEGFTDAIDILGGSHVVAMRRSNGDAGIWETSTGRRIDQFRVNPDGELRGSAGVNKNRPLFSLHYDDGVEIWNAMPPVRIGLRLPVRARDLDVHPDEMHVLIAKGTYQVEIWNLRSGKRGGDTIRTTEPFNSVRFSPDGSWFVSTSGDGMADRSALRLWDTDTLRPLSREFSSLEIIAHAAEGGGTTYFGQDGRFYLAGTAWLYEEGEREVYWSFEFPPATDPVPAWFAELLEAVAGWEVAESGALEPMGDEERRRRIGATRALVAAPAVRDAFATLIRWWLDEGPNRLTTPRGAQKVEDYVQKRLSSGTATDLAMAAEASPGDARIYSKWAAIHRKGYQNGTSASPDGQPKVAEYFTSLARRLSASQAEAAAPSQAPPTARSNEADELFSRAEALRKAHGAAKDLAGALALYRQAATLHHSGAMHRLGVAHALGEGLAKNEEEAVAWYHRSAEAGFAEAQYDLGVRYILGRGVARDEKVGLEWYRKAAAQGYAPAAEALRRRGAAP